MAALPRTRHMTMISFPWQGTLRVAHSSNVLNLSTLFTVLGELSTGFPKVGSVLSEEVKSKLRWEDESLCPKVLSHFDYTNFTICRAFFFLQMHWRVVCVQPMNCGEIPRKINPNISCNCANVLFYSGNHLEGHLMFCANVFKHKQIMF